ncbi:TPA: hypothetical protein ACIBVV_005028, partial [Salmonella enterica subsp. enterica serovar Potsdam]
SPSLTKSMVNYLKTILNKNTEMKKHLLYLFKCNRFCHTAQGDSPQRLNTTAISLFHTISNIDFMRPVMYSDCIRYTGQRYDQKFSP